MIIPIGEEIERTATPFHVATILYQLAVIGTRFTGIIWPEGKARVAP